jgi:hypothetical protein
MSYGSSTKRWNLVRGEEVIDGSGTWVTTMAPVEMSSVSVLALNIKCR